MNRWIIKTLYKTKFYIDIALAQLSWVIGKGPELMSVVYILEKGGIILEINQIIKLVITTATLAILVGMAWHKLGFYDTEIFVNADKNPLTKLILKASRIIIAKEERGEHVEFDKRNHRQQKIKKGIPGKDGRIHQRQQHHQRPKNALAHLFKRPTRIILRSR